MDMSPEAEFELLAAAAVMYYEQHRSQQAIARRLGVSRSTVSRFLSRARELGVVDIQVEAPGRDHGIAGRLAAQLGLRAVHIAPGRAQQAEPGPVLAEPLTAALEETRLTPGDVALASWGRAVAGAVRNLARGDTGAVVAPATGGYATNELWFQPNETARLLAIALNGHPRFLNAPAIVSPGLAAALRAETQTRAVMQLWDRATAAVVGVNAWPSPDPGYAAAGFPVDDPAMASAVGEVAGLAFTADGTEVPWPADRRLLGVAPEQLRRIPHVIGLADGVPQAEAVVGAARAGLVTVLVTDAATARAIAAVAERDPAASDRAEAAVTRPAGR